ncbi:MAG: fused MFS/spermidine synthase [Gammaproteobacteria bacterium]|nr:fused MFS/spermidine synthase [Gammaproteobacteria bacterium]
MRSINLNPVFLFSFSICLVYFFTGVTALSYEVLWARMLSTIFGVSIFGVVVTVSAFMAGLGAGSLVGAKFQSYIKHPLFVFGLIEICVATFAFNLPSIFSELDGSIQSLTNDSGYEQWLFVQALVTFLLMFIPAFGLGFGFPLILKSIIKSKISLGVVYAANTLGGMCGALLPLLLLPVFGWTVSDRLVAIFGLVLGAFIIVISFFNRNAVLDKEIVEEREMSDLQASHNKERLVGWRQLVVYSLIGASAIMLEIGWTRLYGMILLRTEYVMAVILATFLFGIGLGSLLASRSVKRYWLYVLPIVISTSGLASLYLLPDVSAWAETSTYTSLASSMFEQGLIIALFSMPATLAFGAWLPILTSLHKNTSVAGAYLYGANSIGGAIGGIVAGFLLIPFVGTSAVIVFASVLVLFASTYWIKDNWFKAMPVLVAVLFIPVFSFSSVKSLLPISQNQSNDLQVYEDALMVTHVVEDKTGNRLLMADLQRMDASTAPDAITVQKNQSRLPVMLHPSPESVLFLGLGTGITASGTLPYSNLVRESVELSSGSIKAASTWFSRSNNDVVNVTTIIKDDARRYLKSTNKEYDVIIGDLFHPDLVGRSNLLSYQQFERAKARLSDDGLFVQWIALNQFDVATLKVVLGTFKKSFPEASLFVDGFRIALVGFNGDFHGIEDLKNSLSTLTSEQRKEATGGEGVWTWAGRYWGKIPQNNWQIQDEWAPVIEFQLPKAKFNRQLDLGELLRFMLSLHSTEANALIDLQIKPDEVTKFSDSFQATTLYYRSWLAYFSGQNLESQKILSAAYARNSSDQWIGFGMADAMFASLSQAIENGISETEALEKILAIRPDHLAATKRLLSIFLKQGKIKDAEKLKARILEISPFDKVTD